jgi:signal peptidase I
VGYDNQFQTYDIIVLEKVEKSSQLKKYDVIAFVNDEGVNVIHRIVDVVYKADGVHYVTRGDANNGNDTYNPKFSDVIGKYTNQRIPLIGVFVMFLQSYSGMITLVAVIYCLIMIDRMTEKIHVAYANREKILNDAMHFNEVFNVENVVTDFSQTIYYEGYAYVFSEDGLNSKYPISKEEQEKLLAHNNSEAQDNTDDNAPDDIPTNKDEEI